MAKKRGRPPKKIKKGLGDTVESAIKATGLDKFVEGKDCGCDKRKETLNKILPYRLKAKCFTEDQYNWYKDFHKNRTLTLTNEQRVKICQLYSEVFSRPYYEPCINCGKEYITMVTNLDLVFDTYEKEK